MRQQPLNFIQIFFSFYRSFIVISNFDSLKMQSGFLKKVCLMFSASIKIKGLKCLNFGFKKSRFNSSP